MNWFDKIAFQKYTKRICGLGIIACWLFLSFIPASYITTGGIMIFVLVIFNALSVYILLNEDVTKEIEEMEKMQNKGES